MNRVASPTRFGEYLEMGVPVATTDALPSTADVCRDEQVGIVLPADASAGWVATEIDRFVSSADRA